VTKKIPNNRPAKTNTTPAVYSHLKTCTNLTTSQTADTHFLRIQPVQNNNGLLMQSSSGLINLMTFNMASTHHLEISVAGKNHNSLDQLL